ncbi:hypothetical protein QJQ45_017921, partial [Haematococcus lacustris]
ALSSEPGMARVWVMLGSEAVVCVDPAFTDMSGFRSEELLGSQLEDWLLQPEPIASIFQGVRESEVAAARPKAQAQYIALGHHTIAQQNSPLRGLHRASLDQARAAAEAIGSTQQKWVLRNVLVRHHFADPLSCDITISPGAIGSYKFLVFNLRLLQPSLLLVADKHGRVAHVTEALASALGTTPKAIMCNGQPGALQQLLPQPFAALHHLLGSGAALRSVPPLHSCRSGLTVLMNATRKQGPPAPEPFRITLTKHPSETGEPLNVVSFASATHQEALAERRLRLVLSLSGKVLLVLAGDASVFGFDPQQLQGLVLGDFVDAFQAISHSKAALRLQGMYMEGEDAVGSQPLGSQHNSYVPAASAGLERLGSGAIGRTASWVPAPPPGITSTSLAPRLSRLGPSYANQGSLPRSSSPGPLTADVEMQAAPTKELPGDFAGYDPSRGPSSGTTASTPQQPATRLSDVGFLDIASNPAPSRHRETLAWVSAEEQEAGGAAGYGIPRSQLKQGSGCAPTTACGARNDHGTNDANDCAPSSSLSSCVQEQQAVPVSPHCPAALLPAVAAADNDVAAVDAVVGVAAAPKVGATALEPKLSRPSALELQGLQPGFTPVQPGPGVVAAAASKLASPLPEQLPRMSSATAAMAGAASAMGGSDRAERVPTATLEKVLLIMAAKAHSSPGVSWRVGVTKPPEVDHVAALGKLSAFSELVSSLNPAIMTMEVHLTGPKSKALATSLSKSTTAVATPGPTSEKERIDAVLAHVDNNMALVVDLWRADLVTGVLELDEAGTVLHSTALPLYKPGLLFGVPCDRMPAVVVRPLTHCFAPGELQGTHISKFFPTAKNAPVSAFMVPGFGVPAQQPSGEASRKKSNLKSQNVTNRKTPGPVNIMLVKHHSDGDGLELAVQAIRKVGGPTMYLLMRPHLPSSARPNLCKYLLLQREKEVAEAANVASLARYRRSSLINVNPSEAQLLLPAADLDAAAACSTQPVSAYAGMRRPTRTRNLSSTRSSTRTRTMLHATPKALPCCVGAAPFAPSSTLLPPVMPAPAHRPPPRPTHQVNSSFTSCGVQEAFVLSNAHNTGKMLKSTSLMRMPSLPALSPVAEAGVAIRRSHTTQDMAPTPRGVHFPKPTNTYNKPPDKPAANTVPIDRIAVVSAHVLQQPCHQLAEQHGHGLYATSTPSPALLPHAQWVMTGGSMDGESLHQQSPASSPPPKAVGQCCMNSLVTRFVMSTVMVQLSWQQQLRTCIAEPVVKSPVHKVPGPLQAEDSAAPLVVAPLPSFRAPGASSNKLPGQERIVEEDEADGEELDAASSSSGVQPNRHSVLDNSTHFREPLSPSLNGSIGTELLERVAGGRSQPGEATQGYTVTRLVLGLIRQPRGDSDATSEVQSQLAAAQIFGNKSATEASDMMQATDYRRGQRFKKLQRLLLSPAAQRAAQTFNRHCIVVVCGAVLTHLGLFVLQIILLSQQSAGVTDLNSVGIAARTVGKVTHSMHELDVLLSGRGQPNLPGLTGMEDYQGRNDYMNHLLSETLRLHQGVYMGFGKRRQLPDEFGLRQIWDQATQVETVYEDTSPVQNVYQRNVSLWDAGNNYVSKGADIWQNARARHALTSDFGSWTSVRYIIENGPNLVIPAYYQTMNAFLQTVVGQADTLNQIQLLVLLLEGVVVPLGAMLYLWILAMRVTNQRFNMFHVFVLVPVGLIRQLATKPIDLDEEDDDDGAGAVPGAEAGGPAGEAGNRGQTGVAPGGMLEVLSSEQKTEEGGGKAVRMNGAGTEAAEQGIKLNIPRLKASASNLQSSKPLPSALLLEKMAFWMQRGPSYWSQANRVAQSGKRKLRSSNRFAVSLMLPFLAWAVINCTLNAVAYQHLKTAAAPCATFNIVNFFAARVQRVFFYAQELCIATDPAERNATRAILRPRYATMRTEYDAMLYGGAAVPGSSEPRFVLAKQGVVYSGGQGVDILYFTTQCLRVNASSCMGPNDPFYKWTNNGLDRLMRRYFELWETMINSTNGPVPNITGPEYEFMWRAKLDMEDGLDMLNEGFLTTVMSIYSTASLLHYINFAFTVTLMLTLYLLQLRPFDQEARNETRRVAELLSQLPTEVAVMDLVARALQLSSDKQTGGAGNSSMRSMDSGQDEASFKG